ncbi:MAG: thioredoxin family protein [Elusimicrobia bacterium]|jgi:alkyl hydroperoxide reductase subunit AhpC|nr:thioredoxin family protein [Elusimicrobiota bacterium]MBK7208484.1 thioredoxin family protein [Elusimicrobiota bacterium]MBK7545245.1 thioredoxin family protein [Elusimicrobiota bacterium]MBK7688660.1 thioredoxin family protein [Elusimicrobiota bacterium]MBK8126911.1 thioredoxin family protein [Elusimicrobiota bacterium]
MKRHPLIHLFFISLLAAPLCAEVKTSQPAPDFQLTDVDGKKRTLSEHKGQWVVLEWINHGCPFVRKHYEGGNMQALQKEFSARGVRWLSVCSSAKGKQGHMTPGEWRDTVKSKGSRATAVLLDPNGDVGRLYGAKTTPHMFIIDPKGVLVYQGAIDDTASADSADIPSSTNYVREALNQGLSGKTIENAETKPYGCSVKYK